MYNSYLTFQWVSLKAMTFECNVYDTLSQRFLTMKQKSERDRGKFTRRVNGILELCFVINRVICTLLLCFEGTWRRVGLTSKAKSRDVKQRLKRKPDGTFQTRQCAFALFQNVWISRVKLNMLHSSFFYTRNFESWGNSCVTSKLEIWNDEKGFRICFQIEILQT